MQYITELLFTANMANKLVTDRDLKLLLPGSDASRYGLVNKAIKHGELIHIKRGAYVLNHPLVQSKVSQYYLACQLVPHSYISFESALSYHQWIPERVDVISCALSSGRSKSYATPRGNFEYKKIVTSPYESLTGVQRKVIGSQVILLASPLRALFDLVYEKKIKWQGLSFITDSLRIESENLKSLTYNAIEQFDSVYKTKNVLQFIHLLKKAYFNDTDYHPKSFVNIQG